MNTTQKYILWIVIAILVIAFILWLIKKSKNGKANNSTTPSSTPTTATADTVRTPYQQVPQVNATRMGVGGSVNRPSGSARVKGSGQN